MFAPSKARRRIVPRTSKNKKQEQATNTQRNQGRAFPLYFFSSRAASCVTLPSSSAVTTGKAAVLPQGSAALPLCSRAPNIPWEGRYSRRTRTTYNKECLAMTTSPVSAFVHPRDFDSLPLFPKQAGHHPGRALSTKATVSQPEHDRQHRHNG